MDRGKMLVPHWDAPTALEAYRNEREVVRRAHLQVIWAAPVGGSCVGGCAGDGVQPALDREAGGAVERRGADGLGDRRRSNGAVPVLDEAGLAGLAAALEQGPEDSGLWSGRKVAAWNRLLLRNFSCTPLAS